MIEKQSKKTKEEILEDAKKLEEIEDRFYILYVSELWGIDNKNVTQSLIEEISDETELFNIKKINDRVHKEVMSWIFKKVK